MKESGSSLPDLGDPFVRIGDHVCLYCTETQGYTFCESTSCSDNGVLLYHNQVKDNPDHVVNPQAVTFKICIENRYKFNKRLRQLKESITNPEDPDNVRSLEHALEAAEAESKDNISEQKRLNGKRLKYGDVIQFRHLFTEKYLHVHRDRTSSKDKSFLETLMLPYDAKQTKFKVLPKYKVNIEGEFVRTKDKVVIESVKYPSHYLHASKSFLRYDKQPVSELNLGPSATTFTLVKRYVPSDLDYLWRGKNKPTFDIKGSLFGGVIVQLHHKHLEAYLTADGLPGDALQEDIHFMVRESNAREPQSMRRPRYSSTYWQIEHERSIISGEPLGWRCNVRLRHLQSRNYLFINAKDGTVGLCNDTHPYTVFKLHPMYEDPQSPCIRDGMFTRLEHCVTGRWLHGDKDVPYHRRMASIFHKEKLVQASSSEEMQYEDAFSMHRMDYSDMRDIHYILGIIPLFRAMVTGIHVGGELSEQEVISARLSLVELRDFIEENPERRRYLREFKVIDILMRIVMMYGLKNERAEYNPVVMIYEVLYSTVTDNDMESSLYLTKYMDFLQKHIQLQESHAFYVTRIITELYRDKKQVMSSMTAHQMEQSVQLLRKYKHRVYLQFLSTLCICNDVAIPDHQNQLCQALVRRKRGYLFKFELKRDGLVYVWKRRTKEAVTLLSVVQKQRQNFNDDGYDDGEFIREQLYFFLALCHGRNEMCIHAISTEYLSIDVIFSVIQSTEMPPDVRSIFCDMLVALYINVGDKGSILERLANVYVYEKVSRDKNLQQWMSELTGNNEACLPISPEIMDWVIRYVKKNAYLKIRQDEENGLMVSVLKLLCALIQYSQFDAQGVYEAILPPILQLIIGKDNPKAYKKRDSFILAKLSTENTSTEKTIQEMLSRKSTFFLSPTKKKGRLDDQPSLEVRYQAMCLLELLISVHRHFKLEMFMGQFKHIEISETDPNAKRHRLADFLHIDDSSKVKGHWWMSSPTTQLQECLDKINKRTEISEIKHSFKQLVKVAGLNHDEITTKALQLVDKYCNENTYMLTDAHEAQLLVCEESLAVQQTVKSQLPVLRRLVSVKVYAQQITQICDILEKLAGSCVGEEDDKSVAQNVLVNFGLLEVLRDILQIDEQGKNGADSITYESLIRQTLKLLLEMARENNRVKEKLFYSLNILLDVKYAVKHLAELLKEIFRNNDFLCWRVESQHIEKIFQLIALHRDRVPNLVQVLQYMICVGDGQHFRRAIQHMILRICWEKQREAASNALYSFVLSVEEKERILLGENGSGAQAYFIHAVNLAVISSRGVKGPVPDLIPEDEILRILNKKDLCNNMRRPFIKYLVYLSLARGTPGLRAYIMHHQLLWSFIEETTHLLGSLHSYLETAIQRNVTVKFREIPDEFVSDLTSEPNLEEVLLCYVVDAVLPLLSTITEAFTPEASKYGREVKILTRLMNKFMLLAPDVARTLQTKEQLNLLIMTLHSGGTCCNFERKDVNDVIADCERNYEPLRNVTKLETSNVAARVENKVNRKLRNFVSNCKLLFEKKNTVGDQLQLGIKMDRSILSKKYCEENSPERLPLHTDFQRHTRAFVRTETKLIPVPEKFCDIVVLISKLESAGRSARAMERWADQNDIRLELRCLRIVRATLYNNIVLMPDDLNSVGKPINKFRRLDRIKELQNFYTQHGLVSILLNLMNIHNDVMFWEVMALLNCMLYQANSIVQNEILRFFTQTSEEVFFMRVQDFLKQAALMAKERRSIKHHMERCRSTIPAEPKKSKKNGGLKFLRFLKATKIEPDDSEEPEQKAGEVEKDFDMEQLQHFQDDGSVELTLKVVAKMCDGQHNGLQNYLRHQPDNPRSYNLVARITEYLQVSFHSVQADSIQLVIQVFDTLNELCAGNQENRNVILDGKVIDYINFLLRMERYEGCSLQSTLQLYRTISDLLISMIEESSPEAFKVAKDVGSTLDINAVAKAMTRCYTYQSYWWNVFTTQDDIELQKSQTSSKKVSQLAKKVGYKFYSVYARILDVNEGRFRQDHDVLLSCGRAIEYYGNNVLNIEVVKDGYLQKIYFPSSRSKKNLIRQELKESLKWNIDRSSPSEKIRDFMVWSKLIMTSISYQQKVQSNAGSKFLTEYIMLWNYIVIFLSLVLNVFMLSTWKARFSVEDIPVGADSKKDLNASLYSPKPETSLEEITYFWTFLGLAMSHNIFTFVLVCAFVIAENPKVPNGKYFRRLFKKDKSWAKDTTKDSVTRMFSLKTLYHVLLLLFSFMGTFFYGYFFAFHLLNIVNTNELLKSVLKAVTLNGKSLLWVAVLGVIWLYIYALVGFGLFRSVFNPEEELYCASLFQCTVTIIRYGLVGDIDEVLRRHPAENSFTNFGYLTIYQITFFIFFTTIGLNIIFGIIVDTFSELRDLKWRAEKDMRDCCFICSLPSYDFEHHAKGFYHHVQFEHNMWSYIYYFIYLTNTNVNDYTALDYYVHKLFSEEKYDFFPVNKALSLSHFYVEKEEEDKFDMLSKDVSSLLVKVTQQDEVRRSRKEKKQQDRWRKKYARKFRKPRTSSRGPRDDDDDHQGGGDWDEGGGGDDDEGSGGLGYRSGGGGTGRVSAPSGVAAKVRKHKKEKSESRDHSRDLSGAEASPRDGSLRRKHGRSPASSSQPIVPQSQASTFIPAPPPPPRSDSSPMFTRRGSSKKKKGGTIKRKTEGYSSDASSHVTSQKHDAPAESFASQIRQRAQQRRAKMFEKEMSRAELSTEPTQGKQRRSLTRHMTLDVRLKGSGSALELPSVEKGAASDSEMKAKRLPSP